jgi:hypothetical protein
MGKWYPCSECEGACYVPTKDGERVLALMRHHFTPMLRKANEE